MRLLIAFLSPRFQSDRLLANMQPVAGDNITSMDAEPTGWLLLLPAVAAAVAAAVVAVAAIGALFDRNIEPLCPLVDLGPFVCALPHTCFFDRFAFSHPTSATLSSDSTTSMMSVGAEEKL